MPIWQRLFFFLIFCILSISPTHTTCESEECIDMKKGKTNLPPVNPYSNDGYDDDNIPEIDLPKTTDVGNSNSDEVPHHDSLGNQK